MARRTPSRVQGAGNLRKLLRRLPDAARKELAEEFTSIGARLLARAKAETPVRFGRLRNALSFRVAAKTLVLRLGLLTKRARRSNFYGYILDQGRAAKTVKIRRGPRKGATMRIRAIGQEQYNFVFGRRRDLQQNELPKLRRVLDRVLSRAAEGIKGDD